MPEPLTIWIEPCEAELSVREFSVREGLSLPFQVTALCQCALDSLDLEAMAGRPAAFMVQPDGASEVRAWVGICSDAEQLKAEPTGMSTYSFQPGPGCGCSACAATAASSDS